jgi:hypothetical protein
MLTHPEARNNEPGDGPAQPEAVGGAFEIRRAARVGNRGRREQQDAGNTNAAQ